MSTPQPRQPARPRRERPPQDPLLNHRWQAAALGISASHLLALKRRFGSPPAEAVTGNQRLIRSSVLLAWYQSGPYLHDRPGRQRTTPKDLTRAQWASLLALHRDATEPGTRVRFALIAKGIIRFDADTGSRITPAGHRLLDVYAPPTQKEP